MFKNTRRFMRMRSKTKKMFKKLCDKCRVLAATNIHENMENNTPINTELWCDKCKPYLEDLKQNYTEYAENIVKDYEDKIKNESTRS